MLNENIDKVEQFVYLWLRFENGRIPGPDQFKTDDDFRADRMALYHWLADQCETNLEEAMDGLEQFIRKSNAIGDVMPMMKQPQRETYYIP